LLSKSSCYSAGGMGRKPSRQVRCASLSPTPLRFRREVCELIQQLYSPPAPPAAAICWPAGHLQPPWIMWQPCGPWH
jgi:hypothetical protein